MAKKKRNDTQDNFWYNRELLFAGLVLAPFMVLGMIDRSHANLYFLIGAVVAIVGLLGWLLIADKRCKACGRWFAIKVSYDTSTGEIIRRCSHCQTEYRAIFPVNELFDKVAVEHETNTHCPNCDRELPTDDGQFCLYCGSPLNSAFKQKNQ